MRVDLKNAFRLSFVSGGTEPSIPAVPEILAPYRNKSKKKARRR